MEPLPPGSLPEAILFHLQHGTQLMQPLNPPRTVPAVLTIAGYDPSAGAGVLADLKTFAALGVYGMACPTAMTVQSTQGVRRVEALDPATVIETLDCLAEDVRFSAIKVGMLGSFPVATAVLGWLERHPDLTVVLDPVTKSSSGKDLLDARGRRSLREEWLARVTWITPNLSELAELSGTALATTPEETVNAARHLCHLAARQGNPGLRVVVTGGHAQKPDDLLLSPDGMELLPGTWVETASTHGTGCAYSSALAARVALGDGDSAAAAAAKAYVFGALQHAYPMGKGRGPIDHFWQFRR